MFRKKTGLVLGGGGAKGFAHIGVLKFLEENEITIDYVAGTSMGAVIGALHCLGYTSKEIEDLAKNTNFKRLVDLTLPQKGLIKGKKVENYLRHLFEDKKFSDLKKPLLIISADIKNFQEIVFTKGDLTKAVMASISIPGIFVPVLNKGRILVDGGVLNNLPIKTMKAKNPDCIIAVNLEGKRLIQENYETAVSENEDLAIPNIAETLMRTYDLTNLVLLKSVLHEDKNILIISPDTKKIKIQSFDKIEEGIKAGYDCAKENSQKIKSLIGKEGLIEKIKKRIARR